jgi:membrane protein DedA with SNARE-associated domain
MESAIADLISIYGYPIVFLIVLLESSGLPLPGESALIAAAIYAGAGGSLHIVYIIMTASLAAIIGDNFGYWIGLRYGQSVLARYGHKIKLTDKKLDSITQLFQSHGGKIIFFGRFVAILRMLAGPLAGMNRYPWHSFLLFNSLGGIAWSMLFGTLAFFLGDAVRTYAKIISWGGVIVGVLIIATIFVATRITDRAVNKFMQD